MAITYTTDFKGQNNGVGSAITSNALSVTTGDKITLLVYGADNGFITAWSISNNGTAITWTQRADTNTASNSRIFLFEGVAGATPPTTITATATAGTSTTCAKVLYTQIHTGADTGAIPAGNIFVGASSTDVSQSITPSATGSALWMGAADWNETNSFVAIANNTLVGTFHEAGQFSACGIRPTTQPRTDASAFTLGETDTGGAIAYIAFEVQASTTPSSGTSKKLPNKKRKTRRTNTSDFTGFGAFSSVLSAAGLFDKDLVIVASSAGNAGSISSLLNNDLSSISGSQPASGNTGDIVSRANTDLSILTGTQTATGTISSRANTDRSQATGTQTASGTITSRANTDRSQLTGTQAATGTIASRANNDASQLTGIQTASGSITSRANTDLSSLTGIQPASGAINSLLNNDSSVVTGTSGNTVNGTISSIANVDLSSLTGIQAASGSIVSRAKDDASQLTAIQTASGSIVSRTNNDRSALSGSQPASGTITSLLNNDLSSLFGSQGGAVSGFITSRLNDDLSALFGGVQQQTIGFSGGFALPKKQRKKIREYVETAIDSANTIGIPETAVESLENEIIKAVQARNFAEELYIAIYARDMVQMRLDELRQEIEDEDDLLLLS